MDPPTSSRPRRRELFDAPTGPPPDVWTLQHPVLTTLGGVVAPTGIFGPLAVRRYKRMGR